MELVARLDSLGIAIVADEGRLRVNAARGQLTDDLKQAIATHKAELLELLVARDRQKTQPLQPLAHGGALPTSYFQERLWVLDRLEPDSTAYNLVTMWSGDTLVDADRLAAAIAAVVSRHEILRATFHEEGGAPMLRLLPPEAVPIELHDLSSRTPAEQRQALRDAADASAALRFELANQPPARFAVYRLGTERAAALVTVHHIAADAWSMGLLDGEVRATYEGGVAAPLTLQYADYAAWQRETQGAQAIGPELDWWQDRLAGAPALSVFPADRPTLEGARPTGAVHEFIWSAELSKGIRSMVREQGATVYMALLAACATVLYRHTGQDDVVLGSPMGIRERPEFESIIGPFVNLLVIRLDLSDDPSFADLLTRARDAVLDAHAHRRVPFEKLLERLKPPRSLIHSPLFQMAMVQHNAPASDATPIFGGGAIHELTWFARDVDGCLRGSIEYRSDLFTAENIARIGAHMEAVLAAAVQARDRPLSELPLLSSQERDRVIRQFNSTAVRLDSSSVVRQFERQVARAPQAVAVRFKGRELSYGDLNRRANRLARHLRSLGITPGSLVGLCLHRSLDLPVALLGVLKAGATYVPLDPAFPAERLGFMLADSGAAVLLTAADVAANVDVPDGVRRVDLHADVAVQLVLDGSNLEDEPSPESAAYVLYTSGSTGQPKGVAVSHGALSNFLGSMQRAPGLQASDILAAVTTISFDIAGLELYLPLIVGARIELVSRETAGDADALAQLLVTSGATVLQATPATWRMLVETGWQGGMGFRAFCGGEGLPRELADRLRERTGELWNLYGPTETTIWSTAERVGRGTGSVSIGRPIANTQIYILDRAGEPVPIGIPGEVWIGGAGIAIGYHRRPELTAERFLQDPFAGRPVSRVYRTGDLGRWLPDGRLEHMGRIDHQVKVRGFRIELGEIESALARHPHVREAIVSARDDGSGSKQLVAYVVRRGGQALDAVALRDFLRTSLPDYMVPAHVVFMEALPMTANNKVDIKALPDPKQATAATAPSKPVVPPRGPLEVQLMALWRQVLDDDKLGIHDDFFDHGGQSLKAVQLLSRIERVFGRKLPLATLFQAPSVARMAELLTQAHWAPSWRSLVAINPSGTARPMFLVPGVGGNVLMFGVLSKLLGADQPMYGLQAKGLDGTEEPFSSLPEMAAHYVDEILAACPQGPYVVCGSCTGGVVAYEMAQQLVAHGEEVRLVILESWHPSSARVSHWPITALWPVRFVWRKLLNYGHVLGGMPLHRWPAFLRGKLRLGGTSHGAALMQKLAVGDYYSDKVVQSTMRAVARYRPKPYPGGLLNVIASGRRVHRLAVDTRHCWESLARSATTGTVPAEDSGQLFVSPHVEKVAELLSRHLRAGGTYLSDRQPDRQTSIQPQPEYGVPSQ